MSNYEEVFEELRAAESVMRELGIIDEHVQMVQRLAADVSTCTTNDRLATGALGLAGEAGEVVDIVKKVLYHGKPLGVEALARIKDELGDVMWYVQFLCHYVLECSLADVLVGNIEKLESRHPGGKFSNEYMKEGV